LYCARRHKTAFEELQHQKKHDNTNPSFFKISHNLLQHKFTVSRQFEYIHTISAVNNKIRVHQSNPQQPQIKSGNAINKTQTFSSSCFIYHRGS